MFGVSSQRTSTVSHRMLEPWGRLTRREVYECLAPGTLSGSLCTWKELAAAIGQLSSENLERLRKAAEAKEENTWTRKRKANADRMVHLWVVQ